MFAASHLQCEVVLVRVFWLATCGSLNNAMRFLVSVTEVQKMCSWYLELDSGSGMGTTNIFQFQS